MKSFKADLHIHTVLSPCGDLNMSPHKIVSRARERELDVLGITDHNSTRQCEVMKKVGEKYGIYILCGVEINTREEVHCLAFFENTLQIHEFEKILDNHLPAIENDPGKFGYQAVVDEREQILDQPGKLLISALDMGIEEVETKVHEMGGIFIPAHIDRMRNGIIAQLGFVPNSLFCDALEISPFSGYETMIARYPYLKPHTFIQGSDAHFLQDIGKVMTSFYMESPGFDEFKMALAGRNGRKIEMA